MSTIVSTTFTTSRVRVALVIEGGRLKPVWFEQTDKASRDRIFIKKICYIWSEMEGVAKIINFGVWDGSNSYTLSLNTRDFTWKLGIAESAPYPEHRVNWDYRRQESD